MSDKPSYWQETGEYQAVYDRLWEKLIPDCGEAETQHGELLRAISRLAHDYYNNGFCNISNDMYGKYIDLIEEHKAQLVENMSREDFDKVLNEIRKMRDLQIKEEIFHPCKKNPDWNYDGTFPNRLEALVNAIVIHVAKVEGELSTE